jgi:voltage-gated potassium channel Kch
VLSKLLIAWCLMALCVVIHATGLALLLRALRRQPVVQRAWPSIRLFIRLAGWIVFLHLLEITVWALFYVSTHAMPDVQSGLYFSAVTYTTTGYGDLVLPREWQLLGAVEALTGILMCGWSTGSFFAVVGRIFQRSAAPLDSTL